MADPKFIIVIGTSAGGTLVLPELLAQLNSDMRIAVFIVIHMPKRSVADMFVRRLQKHTALKCKIPTHGEAIKSGHVYIAKPDHHLILKKEKVLLGKGPMENRYRPSIDTLFRSAAAEFDHKVIGIVLTGLLEDGAAGMVSIKRSGGTLIVQDPNEAEYPDMPNAVLNNVKVDHVIPVEAMGTAINKIIAKPPKKSKIPADVRKEAEIAERVQIGIDQLVKISEHSLFSCPECGGGLWEMTTNGTTRYRCHVGHGYSENGLLAQMEAGTESALWTAMRIIEERRNLLEKLADKEKINGSKTVAARYKQRIKELTLQIDQLKKVLFATEND
jgi:two-component system, chemotaxis family, protein-glutamate methylesterase/glutaminase